MLATPVRPLSKPVTSNEVAVADAVDRPRRVSAYHRSDRVVLVTPPGEAAVMYPEAARALADRLYEHADAVESRRSGRVLPFPRR